MTSSWGVIGRWRRWRARRGGQHRPGAIRPTTDGLDVELEAAKRRLAGVEALAPHVAARERTVKTWLRNNHIGPLFDEALGLRPGRERRA